MTRPAAFGLCLIVGAAAGIHCCAAPSQSAKAQALIQTLIRYSHPDEGASQEDEHRNWLFWSHTTYDPHNPATRYFQDLPEEKELRRLGRAVTRPVLNALEQPGLDARLQVRLLRLLEEGRDPEAISPLFSLTTSGRDLVVRRAALRSLGLIGSSRVYSLVKSLSESGRVPPQDVLWVRGMCGDDHARQEFYDWITQVLTDALKVSPGHFGIPLINPKELLDDAKMSALAQIPDVFQELVNLADVPEVHTIAILIEYLRHPISRIQHLAEDLLYQKTGAKIGRFAAEDRFSSCLDLHGGQEYEAWNAWFKANAPKLSWSGTERRFANR